MPEVWNKFFKDVPKYYYTIYFLQKNQGEIKLDHEYSSLQVPNINTDYGGFG